MKCSVDKAGNVGREQSSKPEVHHCLEAGLWLRNHCYTLSHSSLTSLTDILDTLPPLSLHLQHTLSTPHTPSSLPLHDPPYLSQLHSLEACACSIAAFVTSAFVELCLPTDTTITHCLPGAPRSLLPTLDDLPTTTPLTHDDNNIKPARTPTLHTIHCTRSSLILARATILAHPDEAYVTRVSHLSRKTSRLEATTIALHIACSGLCTVHRTPHNSTYASSGSPWTNKASNSSKGHRGLQVAACTLPTAAVRQR